MSVGRFSTMHAGYLAAVWSKRAGVGIVSVNMEGTRTLEERALVWIYSCSLTRLAPIISQRREGVEDVT